MKKIAIACLKCEKQATVERLQSLGTVHVVPMEQPASEELDQLRSRQEKLSRILMAIRDVQSSSSEKPQNMEELLQEASEALDGMKKDEEDLASQVKKRAQVLPWGSFDKAALETLRERGIYMALCMASASRMPELPEGAVLKVVNFTNGVNYFAVISSKPLDEANLPLAPLPAETNLDAIDATIRDIERRRTARVLRIDEIGRLYKNALKDYEGTLSDSVDFVKAREGMASSHQIAYLTGYVPATRVDELRGAARENGWAIRYEEVPEDDMEAPTHLILPEKFRMAEWIFDFVGILPGYHETDVSISVLVFLSLFCAMLIGDAGYGLLFTGVVLWLRRRVTNPKNRQGMNLLLVMSLSILVYGALCGNWFAIPMDKLPIRWLDLPWLSDSAVNQKHVQLLSFFIGAFHMSMARLWQSLLVARTINLKEDDVKTFYGKIRGSLGHLGWGLFLWANYGLARVLIVKDGGVGDLEPAFCWLYLIGFLLILVFSIEWRDMGAVIYAPFTFVNSFVDVLSYIRLFAVGLSSVYIADSFNNMAMNLTHISLWLIPASMLIIFFGHILNIALACMGVLVHGIRLNTLEFSGHMNISWSGKPYKPLRKNS